MVFRRATSAVFAVWSLAMLTPAVAAISEFCLPGYTSRDGKSLEAGLSATVYTGCQHSRSCIGETPTKAADFFDNYAIAVPPDQSPADLFDAVVTKIDWPGDYTEAENFAIAYAGYFRPTETGTWTFQTRNDDASYVYIGEAGETLDSLKDGDRADPVVKNPTSNSVVSGTIDLSPGQLLPDIGLLWTGWRRQYHGLENEAPVS